MRELLLPENYKIATICGSLKFKEHMLRAATYLSERGYLVFLPVFEPRHMDRDALHSLHEMKIALSDLVYIVDVDGYYGKDTTREIMFANSKNKTVRFYSKDNPEAILNREKILTYNSKQ